LEEGGTSGAGQAGRKKGKWKFSFPRGERKKERRERFRHHLSRKERARKNFSKKKKEAGCRGRGKGVSAGQINFDKRGPKKKERGKSPSSI